MRSFQNAYVCIGLLLISSFCFAQPLAKCDPLFNFLTPQTVIGSSSDFPLLSLYLKEAELTQKRTSAELFWHSIQTVPVNAWNSNSEPRAIRTFQSFTHQTRRAEQTYFLSEQRLHIKMLRQAGSPSQQFNWTPTNDHFIEIIGYHKDAENRVTEMSQRIPFQFVNEEQRTDQYGHPTGRVRKYEITTVIDGKFRLLRLTLTDSMTKYTNPKTNRKIEEWRFSDRGVSFEITDPVYKDLPALNRANQGVNPVGFFSTGTRRAQFETTLEDYWD